VQVQVEQIDGRRLVIKARGNEIIVDDTLEAGGPGDGFRPTELLMGALGACMIGTMINFARSQDITVGDISMQLQENTADRPTRVERISATMSLATDASERRQDSLRRAAGGCKIHNTLDASPTVEFEFQVR
jgi:putative redox protein